MNEAHLQKQITRLKVLPRGEDRPWGTGEEHGLKHELFKQLWRSAMHDQHAEWVIDRALELCKFCPSPAELAEIAESVPADPGRSEFKQLSPTRCPLCSDSGYKRVVVRRRPSPGAEPENYEFTVPCTHQVPREYRQDSLCPDCRPWGSFGWIVRAGRYEGCPTCPQGHVEAISPLIEAMNNPRHSESHVLRSLFFVGNV